MGTDRTDTTAQPAVIGFICAICVSVIKIKTPMNKQLFQKLGLSPAAANIYLALLKHSPSTISDVSQNSGEYRPTIYKHLPELLNKGLVSQSRRGKRLVYIAESPAKLEKLIETFSDDFHSSLPDMLALHAKGTHRPIIRFFEGKEGIGQIFEQLLIGAKKGDILYRYESPKDYHELYKYYPKLYRQLATRHNPSGHSQIQKFVITNERTQRLRTPNLERYSKSVPPGNNPFEYDITELIFGDKVAFIDYATQTASIIENPTFAKFQRQIFKLLFDRL